MSAPRVSEGHGWRIFYDDPHEQSCELCVGWAVGIRKVLKVLIHQDKFSL